MTVVEAGLKHALVGLEDGGLAAELAAEMGHGLVERTVEEPAHQAEGEDVAALEHALVVETAVGQGVARHLCDGHLQQAFVVDAEFGEWVVGGELCLAEVGGTE